MPNGTSTKKGCAEAACRVAMMQLVGCDEALNVDHCGVARSSSGRPAGSLLLQMRLGKVHQNAGPSTDLFPLQQIKAGVKVGDARLHLQTVKGHTVQWHIARSHNLVHRGALGKIHN